MTSEELILKITGDSAHGQQAVKDLDGMLDHLKESLLHVAQDGFGAMAIAGGTMVAVAAEVSTKLYEMTEHAAELGERFLDLSMKAGTSVPAMSDLGYAVTVAGGSVDGLSNALFMLQKNIGEAGPKVQAGFERLGLSIDAIKQQKPDEQFLTIATALKGIHEPSERAAAAMELFGRQGREMLPLLNKPLEELVAKSKELGYTWTQEEAKGAEEFEMQIRSLKLEFEHIGVTIGRELIPAFSGLIDALRAAAPALELIAKGLFPILGALEKIPDLARTASAAWSLAMGNLKPPPFDADEALARFQAQTAATVPKVLDLKDAEKLLADQLKESQKAIDDHNKEMQKFAELEAKAVAANAYRVVGPTEVDVKVAERLHAAQQHYFEVLERIIPTQRNWTNLMPFTSGEIVETSATLESLDGWLKKVAVEDLPDIVTGTGILKSAFDFTDLFTSLPHIMEQAFTGGGGLTGAFKALGARMGGDITSGLREHFKRMREESGDDGAGGFLGSLFGGDKGGLSGLLSGLAQGGIASAISIGANALVNWIGTIGGPSKDEREARDTFAKQFSSVDEMIAKVSAEGAKLGLSGEVVRQALQKVLDATHVSAKAEQSALTDLNTLLGDAQKKADDAAAAAKSIIPAFDEIAAAGAHSAGELHDLGLEAVAAFAAAVAGGMSTADALKAIGPGLANLKKAYQELGLDVDNAALKNLLLQSTIAEGNPKLMTAIGGLVSEMQALSKMGVDDADTFAAMERTGFQMYTRLQDAAAKAGGSTKDALGPMQAWLHAAAEEAEKLGVPLDANTEMLIRQSKELGIWKDTGKDATGKLVDGISKLVDRFDAFLGKLKDVPTVRAPWADWGNPPDMPRYDRPTDVVPMAEGGAFTVTRPTLFLAGEAGDEDVAFSGGGKRFPSGGGLVIHNHIAVAGSVWSGRDLGVELHDQLSQLLSERVMLRLG